MSNKFRIEMTDTIKDALVKMSDGNPGGLMAMMSMVEVAEDADSNNAYGSFGPLVYLDTFGIYGSRIWCLFKYVCGENPRHALACLRSVQLGILSRAELGRYLDGQSKLDFEVLIPKLVKELPSFKPG